MSRIGKKPIEIPGGVTVTIDGSSVSVQGPKGSLSIVTVPQVSVSQEEKTIIVSLPNENAKNANAFRGMTRALIHNMVIGVTEGFSKALEVNGVGYKAAQQGKKLILNVGYSHPVEYDLPEGIDASVEKNVITITGIDKQLVGNTAAEIRAIRKPEPYKGKGIKYVDEVIRRKVGKVMKAAG